MPAAPLAEMCPCGTGHWHSVVEMRLHWCTRCGSVKRFDSGQWMIPLDKVGEVPHSLFADCNEDDEPTRPDLPRLMVSG